MNKLHDAVDQAISDLEMAALNCRATKLHGLGYILDDIAQTLKEALEECDEN